MAKPLGWILLPLLATFVHPQAATARLEIASADLVRAAKEARNRKDLDGEAAAWNGFMQTISSLRARHQPEPTSTSARNEVLKLRQLAIYAAWAKLGNGKARLETIKEVGTLPASTIYTLAELASPFAVLPEGVSFDLSSRLQADIKELMEQASRHRDSMIAAAVEQGREQLDRVEFGIKRVDRAKRKHLAQLKKQKAANLTRTGAGDPRNRVRRFVQRRNSTGVKRVREFAGAIAEVVGELGLLKPLLPGANPTLRQDIKDLADRARDLDDHLRWVAKVTKTTAPRKRPPGSVRRDTGGHNLKELNGNAPREMLRRTRLPHNHSYNRLQN